MHDPMSVAFEIKRPWPARYPGGGRYWPSIVTIWHVDPEREGDDDSCDWFRGRRDRKNGWYPAMVDEYNQLSPDAQRAVDFLMWGWGKQIRPRRLPVRWHVHHWRIQVHPWQTLRRWLFSRCAACGKRFPWGYSPVSYSWESPPLRWFRGEVGVYHSDCSGRGSGQPQMEQVKT